MEFYPFLYDVDFMKGDENKTFIFEWVDALVWLHPFFFLQIS